MEGRSWKVYKGNGSENLEGLERGWKGEVGRFRKGMEGRTWKV